MSNAFTYEKLFEILRSERNEAILTKLPDTFFDDVAVYFAQKEELLKKLSQGSSVFGSDQADAIAAQIKNAKKLLIEIYNRREKKIVTLAQNVSRSSLDAHDTSTMLQVEQQMLSELVTLLSAQRTKILGTLLSRRSIPVVVAPESSENSTAAVAEPQTDQATQAMEQHDYEVIADIPEFIGPDLERYGPYKKGDHAAVSDVVANILIEQGQLKAA